jgi:hypothetical protein
MSKIDDEWLAYLMSLEKERTDITFSESSEQVHKSQEHLNNTQVKHIKALVSKEIQQMESMREQRDKLFFNAGRYAAGARDEIAKVSHAIMDALLDSEV